jgi:hypothetical protein
MSVFSKRIALEYILALFYKNKVILVPMQTSKWASRVNIPEYFDCPAAP